MSKNKERIYPVTTHEIVDVVAELSRASTDTGTEAKLFIGDEAGPFVILLTCAVAVAVDETSNCSDKKDQISWEMDSYIRRTWVALAIRTSVVQFTPRITCRDVDLCQVADSCNLNVF